MLEKIIAPIRRRIIQGMKKSSVLYISDTTLRDGEQMPGGTLFPDEKVEIAKKLEALGVYFIDAGFPICCESEVEGIKKIAKSVRKPIVSALCRAREEDIDLAHEALKDVTLNKKGVSIFIGTSPQHREYKLRKTKSEIIDVSTKNIVYALKFFPAVSFSPEDASRTEIDFLVELYENAIQAGAGNIGFTDTIGCLNPETTKRYVEEINNRVKNIDKALFAIHFHNDLGMAVANSLVAIKTGYVNIFQGTLLGIGERAGNASLEQVVIATTLNIDGKYPKKPEIDLQELKSACEMVAKYMGVEIPLYQPVVGENVFKTEAGIHQHGILRNPETYEIYPPETIGTTREFVLGKHSGRDALKKSLVDHGFSIPDEQLDSIYKEFKAYFSSHKTIKIGDILKLAGEVA